MLGLYYRTERRGWLYILAAVVLKMVNQAAKIAELEQYIEELETQLAMAEIERDGELAANEELRVELEKLRTRRGELEHILLEQMEKEERG